jgi:redox-sensitive bicupin YhaK (pirin superfamily)
VEGATMLKLRRDAEIHREEGGWFSARWHFSFAHYHDPEYERFGALRVFNDDRLVAGAIWPMHPHKDVEGLTYVVEGTFRHADSLGNDGILPPGSVQRMTLGSGAYHSEQNGSETEPMRFIQLWILPDTADLEPSAEQRAWSKEDHRDRLHLVIGPRGDGDAVTVHQDAGVHVGLLSPSVEVTHELPDGRGAYAYVIGGEATLNGEPVATGDAATAIGERLRVRATAETELILVDVPLQIEPVGIWRDLL